MAIILGKNTWVVSSQSFGQKCSLWNQNTQPSASMGCSLTLQSLYFWIKASFVVLLKESLNNKVKLQKDISSNNHGDWGATCTQTTLYSVAVEYCSISCCLSTLYSLFWAWSGLYSEAWDFVIENLIMGSIAASSEFYNTTMYLRHCCPMLANHEYLINIK